MVSFIDDSTCITGGCKNDSLEELKEKMTQDAQLWHDLLWSSGGKLELPKCGYHLIYYNFNDNGLPHMRVISPADKIILKKDEGVDVPIKAKSIFVPRKNLGHYKSPAGNRSTQATKLLEKAIKLTNDIVKCKCSRSENRMLYLTVWKPSIEYVLPQSFLSKA